MLNKYERKYLRTLAMKLEPILQIGKGGISDNLVNQLDDALTARELIKLRVLQNSDEEEKSVAAELASRLKAENIQVIGHVIVLYRPSLKKTVIDLSKA